MSIDKEHRDRVTNYYKIAQPFYTLLWHRSSLGLHYGFWDETVSNRLQAITRENEVLADLAGVESGEVVLDAGCGVGGSGLWLSRNRNATVYGLNITPSQLTKAQKIATKSEAKPTLGFVVGDYQQLPFKADSVYVYWSLESVEHSTDPEKMIKEAFRVLKPEGRIVIAGTFKGRESLTLRELRQLQTGTEVAGCFNEFRTANEIKLIMEDSGFTNVQDLDRTALVMESSRQMARMCKWGLPLARLFADLHLVDPILIKNNQWGLYQEKLFQSGATSYNVLTASKH